MDPHAIQCEIVERIKKRDALRQRRAQNRHKRPRYKNAIHAANAKKIGRHWARKSNKWTEETEILAHMENDLRNQQADSGEDSLHGKDGLEGLRGD